MLRTERLPAGAGPQQRRRVQAVCRKGALLAVATPWPAPPPALTSGRLPLQGSSQPPSQVRTGAHAAPAQASSLLPRATQ